MRSRLAAPPTRALSVVLGAPAPPGWVDGGHPLEPRVRWADGEVARLRVVVSFDLFTQMQAELHRYRRWLTPEGEIELRLHVSARADAPASAGASLVLVTGSRPPAAGLASDWNEIVVVVPAAAAASWRSMLGDNEAARVVIAEPPMTPVAQLNLGLALCRGERICLGQDGPLEPPAEDLARVVRLAPKVMLLDRAALERLGALHEGFVSARRAFDDFALRAHACGVATAVAREALAGPKTPREHLDDVGFASRWGIPPGATWPASLRPAEATLAVPALPDPALTHAATADGRTWRPHAA